MSWNYKLSQHAKFRAAQRLCNPADLDLALQYGALGHHGILVTKTSIEVAEREAKEACDRVERLRRLQGCFAPIAANGTIITVQRTTKKKYARVARNDAFV